MQKHTNKNTKENNLGGKTREVSLVLQKHRTYSLYRA